jgi:hypothetical protein
MAERTKAAKFEVDDEIITELHFKLRDLVDEYAPEPKILNPISSNQHMRDKAKVWKVIYKMGQSYLRAYSPRTLPRGARKPR